MNNKYPRIIKIAFIIAMAVLASAIMLRFTPNDSWLAFGGWVIFYLAVQTPLFLYTKKSQESCTAWLSRLLGKETKQFL